MQIQSIASLLDTVKNAGAMALQEQTPMLFSDRGFKTDKSIITKVDPMVENYIVQHITSQFPGTNILGEENVRQFDEKKPYTFVLDPIDGTDVFSQGMAGWCISLAMLDSTLTPIAGILFAPKLDILLFADVNQKATLNGHPVSIVDSDEPLSSQSNVMVPSSVHKQLEFHQFPGKIRSIGSAALHLAGPVTYPGIFAGIDGGKGFIWDVAGAHAIISSVGYRFQYISGEPVDYAPMIHGSPVGELILTGPQKRIDALRACLKPLA